MMRWWKTTRRQQGKPLGEPLDPFAAIPVIADGVETRTDGKGWLQVRREAPMQKGVWEHLANRLGMKRAVKIHLDADGAAFWTQINGIRTLREIEAHMRDLLDGPPDAVEKATILFTRMLMERHLIYLKLPGQAIETAGDREGGHGR